MANRTGVLYAVLSVLFVVIFLYSVTLGRFSLSFPELFNMFWRKIFHLPQTWTDAAEIALFNIRLPRIVAAILVGGGLSAAGAVFQGLFKNPMVSPDLLGASTGAGFGACVAISLSFSTFGIQVSAFICGISAVLLAYGIAKVVSRVEMTFTLILTGMVISTMFSSFISMLKFVADPNNKLPAITFWLMGGLTGVNLEQVIALIIPLGVAIVPILLLRYQLNIIAFGDQEAKTLGVNVRFVRMLLIVCSTLLTAGTVAIAGMVGWVGLIIPHIARLLVGPNYKHLLPLSILIGGIFMMMVDDLARGLFTIEIPLGILTSLIGGPFFIYLLFKGRRSYE
ncbi:MAG: iron ABC transporter permease [Desulfosporosinus sp.]|nr:iron ABC transporter permease [Desulfosporosinus sp.]